MLFGTDMQTFVVLFGTRAHIRRAYRCMPTMRDAWMMYMLWGC